MEAIAPSRPPSRPNELRWRRRRALTLAAAAACGALWVVATLWSAGYTHYGSWSAGLTMGSLVVERFDPPLRPPQLLARLPVDRRRVAFRWDQAMVAFWPSWSTSPPPVPLTRIILPLWLPTLLSAALARFAHRRVRAAELVGRCWSCRYDRVGLAPAAPCPECGVRPDALRRSAWSPAQRRWARTRRRADAAGAALALAWFAAVHIGVMLRAGDRHTLGVYGGALAGYAAPLSPATTPRFTVERTGGEILWIPLARVYPDPLALTPPIAWTAAIPLWPFAAIAGIAAARAQLRFMAAARAPAEDTPANAPADA